MSEPVLLTPQIRALIGRAMWDAETTLVRSDDILRYHEAIGDTDIRYDNDGTLLAPPLFLPAFHHGGSIGEDGRRSKPGEIEFDLPVKNRLMAGCDIRFGNPIRAGDTITATTLITSLNEKQGSTGSMLLIETTTTYTNQHGEVHRSETWVVIRR